MDDAVLLLAVLLLAMSQVFQKIAAVTRLSGPHSARAWFKAFLSVPFVLAIMFIVSGTVLWLYVLYRMDLSRAYPFLGLGTVFVVALSRIWLREPVSLTRWFGVALIVIGIALVAGS